jgi:Mor family transcriptional regulator
VNDTTRGELVLVALVELVAEVAKELGVDEDRCSMIGDEVATRFSELYGGGPCYLPKGKVFHTSRLHPEIFEKWKNGVKFEQLRDEYKLSVSYIYRIVKRERQRYMAERQVQLPGMEPQGDPNAR